MTTPTDDDIIYVVNDPAGTPASNKLTMANLKTFVATSLGSRTAGQEVGPVNLTTSLPGATVTAHATPHTVGTAVELIASTAFACETVDVIIPIGPSTSSANTSMLMDIVTGASLNTVLIPKISLGALPAASVIKFRFPLTIPAGTRVGAQIQGAVTVDAVDPYLRLHR